MDSKLCLCAIKSVISYNVLFMSLGVLFNLLEAINRLDVSVFNIKSTN